MTKDKPLSEKKVMCAMPSGWKEVNETKDVKEAVEKFIKNIKGRNLRAEKTILSQFKYYFGEFK